MTKTENEQIVALQTDMTWVKDLLTNMQADQKTISKQFNTLNARVYGISGTIALITSLVMALITGHLRF